MAQSGDLSASRVPGDSISSLSMNGTPEIYPTLLAAGSWDATVDIFRILSYGVLGVYLFFGDQRWKGCGNDI